MKIHDKFVIELAEVIKGYGNDYRVDEPFHLPCDYKFYEISGVSICEESFKKMKRLEDEINVVLDKIRAEIADLEEGISSYHNDRPWVFKDEVLQIIDKYRAESEENNGNNTK